MKESKTIMSGVPRWLMSLVVIAAIAYLTLVPSPLPEPPMPLFDGADKVVHGLMFLVLAWCLNRDISRRKLLVAAVAAFALATAYGGLIEVLQGTMQLGRSADVLDFVADVAGAAIGAIISHLTKR